MLELDCLGDMCPIPLMKLKQCESLTRKGDQVRLVTDHSCVLESITDYCDKKGLQIYVAEPKYKTSTDTFTDICHKIVDNLIGTGIGTTVFVYRIHPVI